jgi:2-polyprenyl-3-methyl-5-hydroxy-6-metoxy-1,4-benzoquinol methylase
VRHAALAALGDHPRFELRVCHLEECDRASLVAERFDTIACINVLEHIEDDVSALRLFADIVGPSRGHVLVFVPPSRRRTVRSTRSWATIGAT